jgi:diguanylate cyclase (GGDEF)-like protein
MHILLLQNSLIDSQKIINDLKNTAITSAISLDDFLQAAQQYEITTIIMHAEDTLLKDALHRTQNNHIIPFLLLLSEKRNFQLTANSHPGRFIDYLQPPFSKELLDQKLCFLNRLYEQGKLLEISINELSSTNEQLATYHKSIEDHSSYLDLLSNRDGLTGLYNRQHFAKTLQHEYLRATEENEDLSLLLLNIDYFNETNKTLGIGFGDFVLNELAARLTQNRRQSDTCFRYSGEEFIVLMPATDLTTATEVAENLLNACRGKSFNNGISERNITCSIGVASIKAHRPEDHEELITMADQALYFAKSEGRNRISVYRSLSDSPLNTSDKNFINLKKTLSRILDKTRSSTINSLQLLAKDVTPEENQKHLKLTKQYIQLLCEQLKLPPSIVDTFKNAITLHTSIHHLLHSDIIQKSDPLTKDDHNTIHDFPYKIMEVTQLFDYFSNERTILLYHGEHYDGSGYPEGLQGDSIPLGARIFNLIDALVAMSSDRPYRKKLPPKEILNELVRYSGTQFDPFLVLKVIDVIEVHGLLDLEECDFSQARGLLIKS